MLVGEALRFHRLRRRSERLLQESASSFGLSSAIVGPRFTRRYQLRQEALSVDLQAEVRRLEENSLLRPAAFL